MDFIHELESRRIRNWKKKMFNVLEVRYLFSALQILETSHIAITEMLRLNCIENV